VSEPDATTPTPPAALRQPSGPLRHALGLLLVIHPIPAAFYVLAVGIFSFIAAASAHRPVAAGTLARVLLAVACTQIAIGSLNDYRDRATDAIAQPYKPLARGLIAPWEALTQVVVASCLVLVLAVPLGPLPLLLVVLIEALGLAYDLGLKGSWASGLLYAVYFPLVPLLAWGVFGRWQPFLPWLLPLGAALGVMMNIANSLPDLEGDLAAGVRGLPHVLGLRRCLLVVWTTPVLVLALLWALALTGVVPARLPLMLIATLAGLLPTAVAIWHYRQAPTARTLRDNFYAQALGIVVLAVSWLAAVVE
jgi:4-hydroxybenzoate polyprenyltransferase